MGSLRTLLCFLGLLYPHGHAFVVRGPIRSLESWDGVSMSHDRDRFPLSSSSSKRFSSAQDDGDGSHNINRSGCMSVDASKKRSLMDSYRYTSYVFGSMGALLFFMPDRTMNTMVASKLGGAAGFGMASGLCYILRGAAQYDRLKSDTYKRLNIGLLGFSLLSLPAIPGEAGFLPTFVPALLLSLIATAARMLGAYTAYRGWRHGLGGDRMASFNELANDIYQGTKDTLAGIRVKRKGRLYRNFHLLIVISCFSTLMDGIFNVRYAKDLAIGLFEISLHWSAVARLCMIATMIYTLKDAAERDRLQGTTFIQLNVLVGLWSFLVGIGQAVYPLGIAPARGALMFAFGCPFFINALINISRKAKSKK